MTRARSNRKYSHCPKARPLSRKEWEAGFQGVDTEKPPFAKDIFLPLNEQGTDPHASLPLC